MELIWRNPFKGPSLLDIEWGQARCPTSRKRIGRCQREGGKRVGGSHNAYLSGPNFPLEGCNTQELIAGRLTSHLLDCGGQINMSYGMGIS